MKSHKRRLTTSEEFDILKMVLDKFLWLGIAIMGYGLYLSIARAVSDGVYYIIGGAIVLIIFAWFLVKEFEHLR